MTPYNPVTSDEERHLIQQWQAHQCERSRRRLYDAFLPFIEKQAAKRRHIEFEDAVQIASIGFVKALDTFDLDQGVRFTTHLHWQIRGSFSNPNDKRYDRNKGKEVATLDGPIEPGADMTFKDALIDPTPEDYDGNKISDGLTKAVATLKQRDRFVIAGRAHGLTLQNLADHYGISRERVRQIENKALDILRKRVPQGYRYHLQEVRYD